MKYQYPYCKPRHQDLIISRPTLPLVPHTGDETVVFTHYRNNRQLGINATRADFETVRDAQAGFNVEAGDVIKVYIVDQLTNSTERNPVILQ